MSRESLTDSFPNVFVLRHATLLIETFFAWLLWPYTAVAIFHLPTITFLQAWLLLLLINCMAPGQIRPYRVSVVPKGELFP